MVNHERKYLDTLVGFLGPMLNTKIATQDIYSLIYWIFELSADITSMYVDLKIPSINHKEGKNAILSRVCMSRNES